MWKKIWLAAYTEKRLASAISSRLSRFFKGLRYIVNDPSSNLISIHCPEYIEPDENDLEIVERIFCSYRRMKEDQKRVSELYLPSSLWQAQLNRSYSYLLSALEENNVCKFHYFLANFGVWEEYTGVEESTLIRENSKSSIRRLYLKNDIFYNLLRLWQHFYNYRKPISYLSRPRYGNLSGANVNGVFVTVDSFFSEIYGSLLYQLICDNNEHSVVAELGAGCGRLAFYALRDLQVFTYIDFDLPEILCLAAYYLMMVYPDKAVLLYGEKEYSPTAHEKYDLIFMPAWEICKVAPSTVDLFINENSLGEMTEEAVANYVYYITRSTKYFFHINHDRVPNIYSKDERSLLGYEYPVPPEQFTLLFRYPDLKHLLFQGGSLDLESDIFIYLYRRKAGADHGTGPSHLC